MGDKKKKKKADKKVKKSAVKAPTTLVKKALKATKPRKIVKAAKEHPMIAEVIAAALVATAAALKNPDKARRLAEDARDELTKIGQAGAEGSSELWQLAVEIGRRAIDSIGPGEDRKAPSKPASVKK